MEPTSQIKRVVSLGLPAKRLKRNTVLDEEPPESQLLELCSECMALGIKFELPPARVVAGFVLRHASCRMEALFQSYEPMIWKVGFTHDPAWRWSNKLYGYNQSLDKWSEMRVLYIAQDHNGPAMLESALIDKFRGNMV